MEKLRQILTLYGVDNIDKKLEKYGKYRENILDWNEKVNLTSITNLEEFEEKHFVDSLACIGSDEFISAKTIIDVGSGGGFPGIPLAIAYPEKEYLLLDSSAKRMRIVSDVAESLGIENVRTIHGRAEDAGKDESLRESFDLCVSRAVAALPVLLEYCLPFVKVGGTFISYKGPGSDAEFEEGKKALDVLGGKFSRELELKETHFSGDGNGSHKLFFFKKVSPTPPSYPRSAGKPSKKPIR